MTRFLTKDYIETLDWAPQSPNLNVIENVWSYIKRQRNRRSDKNQGRNNLQRLNLGGGPTNKIHSKLDLFSS